MTTSGELSGGGANGGQGVGVSSAGDTTWLGGDVSHVFLLGFHH